MRDKIDPIAEYATAMSGPVPDYLHEVERQTYLKTLAPQMMSGQLQGRMLSLFSKLIKPVAALEIGTFTGYATLCLAEGLAEGGKLHTIEGNPEHAFWAERNFTASPFAERIVLHTTRAEDVLPTLPRQWDLVFLDGNKRSYPEYFAYFAERLRLGGLLLADNVLWDGRANQKEKNADVLALRKYNELVAEDDRFEVVVFPVRDGLSVARRL